MSETLNMPTMLACGLVMVAALGVSDRRPSRGRIAAAMATAAAMLAVACAIDVLIVDFDTASTAVEAPLSQLMVVVFALTVCRMAPAPGIYAAIWAQIGASMLSELVDLATMLLPDPWRVICRLALTAAVCAAAYALCRRRLGPWLQTTGSHRIGRRKLVFAVCVGVIFLLLSNYQLIFLLIGSSGHSYMVPTFRLLIGALSLLTLYLQNDIERRQRTQMELDTVRQLWRSKQGQYEVAKETIEIINRKCHDLKYQLAAFRMMHDDAEIDRRLGEVERSVMIYDSAVKTGNQVLDVVLTEKSLYCEAHHITMTCMADGSGLGFIEQTDLYALFGNALDNAIESVMRQEDEDKRIIQVSVRQERGFLIIGVRNYCDRPVELVDGLPVTTKTQDRGYHGYGLRGIRYTAEKYGGTMDIRVADESFTLQVLIPVASAA